jgi:glyoxylase-like metal-dependent hydrolase (beta-lactamase superfamily II)
VLGQELRVDLGQPDVANTVVHRAGRTLVMVDTGACGAFRGPLREAVGRLAPWSEVLLLTTHGHLDHVGNNDLIDELAAETGIAAANVRHFVPAHDAAQLSDPAGYWRANLARLAGVVAGFEDVDAIVPLVLGLFAPLRATGASTRTYEELPLEHLRIGPAHVTGWSFCGGAVQVVRTQGHCAGQGVVHLAGPKLLHLSDEPNGPCAAMHDADQVKMLGALGWALAALESGAVEHATEGHQFEVYGRQAAAGRLSGLIDDAAQLDAAVQPAAAGACTSREFVTAFEKATSALTGATANANSMFVAMAALSKLRDLGMVAQPGPDGGAWSRPRW